MSVAAASTPLAATDQNGSDACPCVTTTNRKSRCVTPFPPPPPSPSPPPPSPVHAAAPSAKTSASAAHLLIIDPTPSSTRWARRSRHQDLPPPRRPHLLPRPLQEREATPRVLYRARSFSGLTIEHLVVFEYVPTGVPGLLEHPHDRRHVEVALAQSAIEADPDRIPVGEAPRSDPLGHRARDVLQVDVDDARRGCASEVERIPAADQDVSGVEA